MPQVSKIPLKKNLQEKIDNLFIESLNSCSSKETLRNYLDDLITPTEKVMLSKRLAIVYLLEKNYPYNLISSTLNVSTSTIGRISLNLKYKGKGVRKVIKTLSRRKELKNFFQSLGDAVIELLGKGKGGDWKSTGKYLYQRNKERKSPI